MKTKFIIATVFTALLATPAAMYSQYTTPTPTPSATSKLTLDRLPSAVQDTVRKEAAGREIAKIERDTWKGQSGYRIEFKESGRNPDVYVADNGSVIRPEEKGPGAKTLFMGTKFESTPAAVQNTIRREVGTGEITKIDREGHKDARFYKVYVKEPQGTTYELQIGEDGKIQQDSRQAVNQMNR